MAVLIDTHVVLWMLDGTLPRRSARAATAVADALADREVHLSIGSFLDLRYLHDAGRLDDATLGRVERTVTRSHMSVVPLDLDVHHAMGRVTRAQIPDPFDRIIVGTALMRGLPLVSADRRIRTALGRRIVW